MNLYQLMKSNGEMSVPLVTTKSDPSSCAERPTVPSPPSTCHFSHDYYKHEHKKRYASVTQSTVDSTGEPSLEEDGILDRWESSKTNSGHNESHQTTVVEHVVVSDDADGTVISAITLEANLLDTSETVSGSDGIRKRWIDGEDLDEKQDKALSVKDSPDRKKEQYKYFKTLIAHKREPHGFRDRKKDHHNLRMGAHANSEMKDESTHEERPKHMSSDEVSPEDRKTAKYEFFKKLQTQKRNDDECQSRKQHPWRHPRPRTHTFEL